jgi:hypothetical protein
MDKDPEDVRYNFIRWLNNDISTAIGPSRVNPMTGEILDADVVLTDGWIRVFTYRWNDILGEQAMEGFGPETMAWLAKNPSSGTRGSASPTGTSGPRSSPASSAGASPASAGTPPPRSTRS